MKNTISILENWREKNATPENPKPKIVFINASGGGLKATVFAMRMLQIADKETSGELMKHTFLLTGASGGMLGSAYFRELYWKDLEEEKNERFNPQFTYNVAGDLLNPVTTAIAVNDIFYPWQSFTEGGHRYRKDRAYMFEKQFNENTEGILEKPLSAYKEAEFEAQIPMMIFTPTIINDERKAYISSQPVSYLTKAISREAHHSRAEVNGLDFCHYFENHDGINVKMSSILRVSATFPYVLPSVKLPTEPAIQLMDAGISDNFGTETTIRFVEVFSDWIKENTGGVVIIQMRGVERRKPIHGHDRMGLFEKLVNPAGNLYLNWIQMQDYQHDFLMEMAGNVLAGNLEVIEFEYIPKDRKEKASMSFHLTEKEKRDILNSTGDLKNISGVMRLKQLLTAAN